MNEIAVLYDGTIKVYNLQCPNCGQEKIGGVIFEKVQFQEVHTLYGKLRVRPCEDCQEDYECKHESAKEDDCVCLECGQIIVSITDECDGCLDFDTCYYGFKGW